MAAQRAQSVSAMEEGRRMKRREFFKLAALATSATTSGFSCSLPVTPVTHQTSHRPWPLPTSRWILFMRWHDLLFLHWPIRPEYLRPLIPPRLELDTFDGWCWIGVVPFQMSGVRPRHVPVPLALPEINVRTYVTTANRSGVWFFSLDASSWIAVRVARWLGLPYYDARIKVNLTGDAVRYESMRTHNQGGHAEFSADYGPTGDDYHAAPGTLDHWLTERYCLFAAANPDKVVYGEIHHPPWALQTAEVELRVNTMTQPISVELPERKPVAHFARLQEVVAWPIVPIERAAADL
jgi:uncharacterized protein YqjF (DUF2071 family)